MYANIEKTNLDTVQEDSYFRPNVIRLKPSSRKNIMVNAMNVPMSSIIIDAPKEESKNDVDNKVADNEIIQVGETKTASLYFINTDTAAQVEKGKPINLNQKMFNVMAKKHDEMMSKVASPEVADDMIDISVEDYVEIEDDETVDEDFDKVMAAIDNVIENKEQDLPEPIVEEPIEPVVEVSIEVPTEEVEDFKIIASKFAELVSNETQAEKELTASKENFEKNTNALEMAKEEQSKEIIRKYELEEAIKVETSRQKEILERQSGIINSKISDLKKEKASIDLQNEEKVAELENTNISLNAIKNENNSLEEIYKAIINSYDKSDEPAIRR